jgi:hypothetical protein
MHYSLSKHHCRALIGAGSVGKVGEVAEQVGVDEQVVERVRFVELDAA